ncbi:MAG: hypothetical protein GC191_10515 [Azospirillum sp.]|nr:hypothetical protein [Azospirillum sp.]
MPHPGILAALRRSITKPPPPPEIRGLLPRRGFEAMLEHILDLLSGIHTPVSLFAVTPPPRAPASLEATIADALAPLGCIGRLPDRRIGLVYLGPRGAEDSNGEALHNLIRARIERRLSDRGWCRQADGVGLAATHGWTDGKAKAGELIAALPVNRVTPRLSC